MIHFVTARKDHNYTRTASIYEARKYMKDLAQRREFIAIDIETNGLDPYQDDILLIAAGDYNNQYVFDMTSYDVRAIFDGLPWYAGFIGHNIKFDHKFFQASGQAPKMPFLYDTMIVEQIISQGDKTRRNNYAATVLRRTGKKILKDVRSEFINMACDESTVFEPRHIMYTGGDIKYLHPIRLAQLKFIQKYNLEERLDIELALIPVISSMELRGINLDEISWKDNITINRKLADDLQSRMDIELRDQAAKFSIDLPKYTKPRVHKDYVVSDLFSGDTVVRAESDHNTNYGSPEQIKEVFRDFGLPLPMDKHGKVTVGKEVMQQYNILHYNNPLSDFINLYLQYIKVRKKLTSFGENILKMRHPVTGGIHTIYKQCSTSTGRFASGDTKNGHPNMAQIPRENQYRIPFKARPGYKIMTIDFTGCELTILASESKDRKLISLLMDEDKDLHTYLANACWRVLKNDPDYEITPAERTAFKGVNFGMVYGATPMRIASLLNIPLEQAKQIEETLRMEIPQVFNYLDSVSQKAVKNGYVVFNNRTNSRRWFKEVLSSFGGEPLDRTSRGNVERAAKNAPIQGTNADMMKECMVKLHAYFDKKDIDAHILLQVYDELVIEINEKIAYKEAPIIQDIMNDVADQYLDTSLGIHMSSDFKIDKNWVK